MDAHLTAALDDEALHDGARIICRHAHGVHREPCPCDRCIRCMMSINEALSGIIFHDRDQVLAKVVELRTIIAERLERAARKPQASG